LITTIVKREFRLISYSWIVLGLITLIHIMNAYSGRSIFPLAPFLQTHLNLQHVHIGMLNSVFFMGAFFFSIPMGYLVDRIGVRWSIILGQLILGLSICLVSLAHSYYIICVYLFLAGIGHAAINPATGRAVVDWFTPKSRATAMGMKQTGLPVGAALAAATLPTLALTIGWRVALVVAGFFSLFSVFLCFIFYKEPITNKHFDKIQSTNIQSLILMFKNKNLMLLSGSMIIFVSLQSSLETYLVLFCKDSLKFSVVASGYLLSICYIGGIVGRLGWGPVSDLFFRGKRKQVLMIIGTTSFLLCLTFIFLSFNLSAWLLGFIIFIFGACAIGWNGIYLTLAAELVARGQEGKAIGTSLTIVFSGIFLGPPFFGYIIDKTHSYDIAWAFFGFIVFLATLFLLLIQEPRKIY